MQNKTMRHYDIPIKMAKIKRLTIPCVGNYVL